MKYKVRLVIEEIVEATDKKDAVNELWYNAWDNAGSSNPDPKWVESVELVEDDDTPS